MQGATRNPLADPGVLGVSSGAGLRAVLVVTAAPAASTWRVAGAAFAGAGVAALVVFGLAARGGFRQNRLVLVGVGVLAGLTALISLLIVVTDPFNANKALTWLSGSTYGRTWQDSLPVAVVLIVALVLVLPKHRELDLVSLDEDSPASSASASAEPASASSRSQSCSRRPQSRPSEQSGSSDSSPRTPRAHS